ncbi:MAG: shikimate dehydrogenase [Clostridia bacterium]|nr:shikimate dehydrogenase [Clostridia bacterium]
MKYGLIAEKLGHSYSKTIHEMIGRYGYDLMPMPEEEVRRFLLERKFNGINVTIPYKSTVIPYLDWISPQASEIGAVNTIVNKNGKLYGYNTDYAGFRATLMRAGFNVSGKNVLILGSGGTSKTVRCACRDLGARAVFVASRTPEDGRISYDQAKEAAIDYIINTTPAGMYPNTGNSAIDIRDFKGVSGVVDVIFNPLRTKLLLDCEDAGIPCADGLYMLVTQAMASAELFTGIPVKRAEGERIYKELRKITENTVLTGMPGSGKSTVGRLLAEKTGKTFIDTDEELTKKIGNIADFINKNGEAAFRDEETAVIKAVVADTRGAVIATGGGAVLREENVRALRENGVICYIDRRLSLIEPDGSRPLSSDRKALKARYLERRGIYEKTCDHRVINNIRPEEAVRRIMKIQKGRKA